MKSFRSLAASILMVLATSLVAYAQATIPVSGQKVYTNVTPNLLTGRLLFTVTDTSNNPISYTPQGGSLTAATIPIPVIKGVVQNVGGFPAQIPNPLTMTPSGTRYRIDAQNNDGSITYYTLPLTNINTASWSYDGYAVPTGIVATGMGEPKLACSPGAQYSNTSASDPYNWVCSSLRNDGSVYWTQNPFVLPNACPLLSQALVSNRFGADFCVDSQQAYVTGGMVIGQSTGVVGPFQVIPAPGGTGGGGTPVGKGAIQIGNADLTAFYNGGIYNTDVYATGGGNNGIANFQASTNCNGSSCTAQTPPTSIDATPFNALPQKAGAPSSAVQYLKGNVFGLAATNPTIPFSSIVNAFGQYQIARPTNVVFTEVNPSSIQGAFQQATGDWNVFAAPGYSNGDAGCPMNCPQPGKTGGGQWTVSIANPRSNTFYTPGIRQTTNNDSNFYGIGDCQGDGGFVRYMGGFQAGSDEGCYGWPHMHLWTSADWVGTIQTISDANHLKTDAGVLTQGDGRFMYGTAINSTEARPVSQISITTITIPNSSDGTYGYATFSPTNAAGQTVTIPPSYARGRLAADCTVPIQDYGFGAANNGAGCVVNVIAGTFDTAAPVCMGYLRAGWFNIGVKVTAASAPSGGQQTLTMTMRHSVPATGWVFQGGACSSVLSLDIDQMPAAGNGNVHGSVFPVLGSLAGNQVAFMNYNASQSWSSIPNSGSQFRPANTAAGGTFSMSNLTRVGGVVNATFLTGLQGNPPPNLAVQSAGFFAISGCSDSSMNVVIPTSSGQILPTFNTLRYNQAGADTSCSTATLKLNDSTATLFWGAEVEDVANHSPGIAANSVVDGTMTTTWQPNFTVGMAMTMPPHYAQSTIGLRNDMSLSTPSQQSTGLNCNIGLTSALMGANNVGSCIQMQNDPTLNLMVLGGGAGVPSNGIVSQGIWKNWLSMRDAPMFNGSVLQIGRFLNSYANMPWQQQFNIWTTGGDDHQTGLFFNEASQVYGMFFNFQVQAPSITYTLNQNTFNNPTSFRSSQFQNITDLSNPQNQISSNYTKLSTCGFYSPQSLTYNVLANTPVCYGGVIDGLLAINQVGTPGTTQNTYVLVVNDDAGPTAGNMTTTFSSNATLDGTNYNTISCASLPAGKTGTIYTFINPLVYPVGSLNNCPNAATTVLDQGVYGTGQTNRIWSAGKNLYSGGFGATGLTGSYGFTQADVFGTINPPQTITAQISQLSEGNLSVDTGIIGNSLGSLKLAKVITPIIQGGGGGSILMTGTASNTDAAGRLTLSAATSIAYTFTSGPYTTAPVCTVTPQASVATSGSPFITYSGTTSFTINFDAAFTGIVGYHCTGLN